MDVQMQPLFQNTTLKNVTTKKPAKRKPSPEPLNLQLRKPDLLKFYKRYKAFPREHLLAILCELLDINTQSMEQYQAYLKQGKHYSAQGRHRVCSALGHYCPVFAEVPGVYDWIEYLVKQPMEMSEEVGLFNLAKAIFKYVFYGWFRMHPLPNYALISSVEILTKLQYPTLSCPAEAVEQLVGGFFTFFKPDETVAIIVDCLLAQQPRYMEHLLMGVLVMYRKEIESKADLRQLWKNGFEYKVAELMKMTRAALKKEQPKVEVWQATPSYEQCLEYEIKYPVGLKATALSKQDNYIASIKNVETQKELDNQRQKLQDLVQAIKVDRDNYGRTVEAMNRKLHQQQPQPPASDKLQVEQIARIKQLIEAVSTEPTKPTLKIPKQRLPAARYDNAQQQALVSLTLQKHIGESLQPVVLGINRAYAQSKQPKQNAQPSPLEEELVGLVRLKDRLEDQRMRIVREQLGRDFEARLGEETLAARAQQRKIIEKEGAKANRQFRRLVEEVVEAAYPDSGYATQEDLYLDKEIDRLRAEVDRKKQILQRLH